MRATEPVEGLRMRHLAVKNDVGLALHSALRRITTLLRTSTRSNRTFLRQQLNKLKLKRYKRVQSGLEQAVASILTWLQRCRRVVRHPERVVLVIAAVVSLLAEIAPGTAPLAVKPVLAVVHAVAPAE